MTTPVWGDPLSCRYSWIEPGDLTDYADAVGHVARKVGSTTVALAAVAAIPQSAFAGATAEAVRSHADQRSGDATVLHTSLREVAGAIREHADVLRDYRDALDGLLRLATERGLDVRDHTIWPPVATLAPSPTQQQYDAWITAWKSYRACFDLKIEVEAERRDRTHELARAMTTHTDARPASHDEHVADHDRGAVDFGRGRDDDADQRHRAADRARRTLEIHERLESSLEQVARLRESYRTALEELQRLSRAVAPDDELTALARQVRLAAEALRAERTEAASLQAELAGRIS